MGRKLSLVLLSLLLLVLALIGAVLWQNHTNEVRLRQLTALLEADLFEYEKNRWPRPPAFGEPVEGTMLAYVARARTALQMAGDLTLDEGVEDWLWSEESNDPDGLPPFVVAWLERRADAIEELLLAARAREIGVWTDVRACLDLVLKPSDLGIGDLMKMFELLRFDALRRATEGRPADAVERILALDRIGRDCRTGAPLLRWLLGTNASAAAVRTAAGLVGRGALGEAAVRRLETWARAGAGEVIDWGPMTSAELLTFQCQLRLCAEGKLASPYTIFGGFDVADSFARPAWAERALKSDRGPVLDLWEALRALGPRLASAAGASRAIEVWGRAADDSGDPGIEFVGRMWTEKLLPLSAKNALELRLAFRALALGIRLRRYHAEHGEWPATLKPLDPPDAEGRKWVYDFEPETGKPFIDVDPPVDDDPEESSRLFRVR